MFEWNNQKAISNFEKHKVSFEEACGVFNDPDGFEITDEEHSKTEQRCKRLGSSMCGRILLVIYTIRRSKDGKEKIRIISTRQASRKERKIYAG